MVSKYKRSGWFKESKRHGLAAKGIKTGRKNYAIDPVIKTGLIGTGVGAVGAGVGELVAGLPKPIEISAFTAADVPNILVDIVGISAANIVKLVPYVVVAGVTYEGVKGLHKLASLYYDKKLSREAIKRKISTSGSKTVTVTKEELGLLIPEETHVVSVRDPEKVQITYAKENKITGKPGAWYVKNAKTGDRFGPLEKKSDAEKYVKFFSIKKIKR